MIQDRYHPDDANAGAGAARRPWRVLAPVLASSDGETIPARLEMPCSETSDPDVLRRALHQSETQQRRAAYLIAAAGHDLRQPLQVIVMALDALAASRPGVRELEYLSVAADQISNLDAGLTDLAIAARLSEPLFTYVPLRDVLGSAAESWRLHAASRDLALRVRKTDLVAYTDPRLLITALRNLVGNAVKHTRAGGVLVGCRRRLEGVQIDVVDTGPGMPHAIDALGAHRRGQTRGEGLGLGLAIATDAVERLGCTLRVRTVEGRGTRFSLIIPNHPRRG